ncbi:aspartyl-phosphate phosphatase Spo0E family protein [Peribacillus cavernae]|uniref:Aspartyl-phosphate phosphatase Spo0E family protein n=1 Tax=Peribacillus cavernae TaxID=1674310 RepID=A0A3S0U7V9_9BACI|nr:aspartyl-phosphate phosphatase Spo0E family protein [Peribacillus cavernae]MDQ0220295.1 hypothetical protein [Peribacillus cavernae]RUQ31954.1 aspartyl-phosphate phosphatase Spo0E family protein [Peribacillus cavernae]
MWDLYEILCCQIEQKREEMLLLERSHGRSSSQVIDASQQLDRLLNMLYGLKNQKVMAGAANDLTIPL